MLAEFVYQASELPYQCAWIERSRSLFDVFDSFVQDEPDQLGNAMRHRPGRPLAFNFGLQTRKQTGKKRILGMDRAPGVLAQQPPQIPISPAAILSRIAQPLTPKMSLATALSLIPPCSSRPSTWLRITPSMRFKCTRDRVSQRQLRCSAPGMKLSSRSPECQRSANRRASRKSAFRPRGARVFNGCVKCSLKCASSPYHTGRQYCAVDSIT